MKHSVEQKGKNKSSLRHLFLLSSYFVWLPPWHVILFLYLLWASDMAKFISFVSFVILTISCSLFVSLFFTPLFLFLKTSWCIFINPKDWREKPCDSEMRKESATNQGCSFCLCCVKTDQGIGLHRNHCLRVGLAGFYSYTWTKIINTVSLMEITYFV